ncbi:hypothetical protein LXL04_002464 [Taraxacum kok-saghyz]
MGTKHHSSDPVSDPKKRRKVGFSKVDEGFQPNDCIKIYMVSRQEEVGSPESFPVEPVDLSPFFEEDGKIYGYQGLKITIWISSISFQAYADISFESTSDAGKGVTDLKTSLQNIFADNLVETKDDFLKTFSTESNYIKSMISNGKTIHQNTPSDLEVIRVEGTSMGLLYCRLVPLVLLLVDGSNPIDVTDPDWEVYLLLEKKPDESLKLVGFAALYRFFHYPDTQRLRLGQILVLPPYQRKGYGGHLFETLTNMAVSENIHDLSIEEPLDSLQHIRSCIDIPRLLALQAIQPSLDSTVLRLKQQNLEKQTETGKFTPPGSAIEEARKALKMNRKQFVQCWEILVYVKLGGEERYMGNFRRVVMERIRGDVIGRDSGGAGKRVIEVPTEYDEDASFVMFRTGGGDEGKEVEMEEQDLSKQEEQLQKLVDERIQAIKLVANKVC